MTPKRVKMSRMRMQREESAREARREVVFKDGANFILLIPLSLFFFPHRRYVSFIQGVGEPPL